ncbi:hypothetical protein GGE65_007664 [Skermanella aerolata]|uniref:hypothetical protein n=1 Tax=Skermanella aerolata TaxID=393310 RepID=UPI003D1AEE13
MKSDYTMNHPPIPPYHVRVVVHLGEIVHRLDVPVDQIIACLEDFEGSFTLPLQNYRGTVAGIIKVSEITRDAATCGYKLTMAQGALWLLIHSGQGRALEARRELERLIDQDGGALIEASCSGFSRGWAFEVLPTAFAPQHVIVNSQPAIPAGSPSH